MKLGSQSQSQMLVSALQDWGGPEQGAEGEETNKASRSGTAREGQPCLDLFELDQELIRKIKHDRQFFKPQASAA